MEESKTRAKKMNVAFFHAPGIGNYQEIFDEMISRIINTGLIDKLDVIFVNKAGGGLVETFHKKIRYVSAGNPGDYEYSTLDILRSYCLGLEDDHNVLYIHLKGCSRSFGEVEKKKMDSWREFLSYFIIDKYEECLLELEKGFDVCSVSYREQPSIHFSGNFWWAKVGYIKTLPNIDVDYRKRGRYFAEFWIGMTPGAKMKSLYTDQHDFYLHGVIDKKAYRNDQ